MMLSPVEIAERQFDAYNAHDLELFLVNFADSVKAYRMPTLEPAIVDKAALRDFYATQRFNLPTLRAELLSRIVLGNKVIDHERISGLKDQPVEMVAIFEVSQGLIQTVWFFSAE